MIRLLTSALLLTAIAVPALACNYNQTATASHSQTVASQPASGHATSSTPGQRQS